MKYINTLLLQLIFIGAGIAKPDGYKDFENKSYIRSGVLQPTNKFFSFNLEDDINDEDYIVRRFGWEMEVGSIIMFNKINMGTKMRLGLSGDWFSVAFAHADIKNISNSKKKIRNSYTTIFIGPKIGPAISYSPIENMYLDLYAKAHINILSPTHAKKIKEEVKAKKESECYCDGTYYYTDDTEDFPKTESDENIYFIGHKNSFTSSNIPINLRPSVGLHIRYFAAIININYSFGRMRTFGADGFFYDEEDSWKETKTIKDIHGKNLNYSTFSITLGVLL